MTGGFVLAGRRAVVATMHGKARVIEPPLADLGLAFLPVPPLDTDRFGTFTRDVARAGSQHDALLAKAQAALALVPEADFAVASEGAFGPHPQIPFLPSGYEMVALVERASGRAVVGRDLTTHTNFAQTEVRNADDIARFAAQIGFPDQAVVVMHGSDGPVVAKGIADAAALDAAVAPLLAAAGCAWLETDMRAHRNPVRMRAIAVATTDLVRRLLARCPQCGYPDWTPRYLPGRPCAACGDPTIEAWVETCRCAGCGHLSARCIDPDRRAEPGHCATCNP